MDQDQVKLTEEDIEICQRAFGDLDEDGTDTIKVHDLKIALDRIGFNPSENELYKLISEVDEDYNGLIKFNSFLEIYAKHKYANVDDYYLDILDAFVAMGGNEDFSGKVDAAKLIETIKNEFKMTIDIEKLINEIDKDESGEIEFDEFKALLRANYTNELT